MPMHTHYGPNLSVTITPLRRQRTIMFSVNQTHYDEIAASLGEEPYMPCGYGFCGTIERALEAGLSHAANVHGAAQILTNRLAEHAHREDVMAALAEYVRVTRDDRRHLTEDPA
jgi:hypothetical protein